MEDRCKCGSYAINPKLHSRDPKKNLHLCDVCYWKEEAKQLQAEVERLGKRDCNAAIELAYKTAKYPFNKEQLKVVDVSVSDNKYIVESALIEQLQADLAKAKPVLDAAKEQMIATYQLKLAVSTSSDDRNDYERLRVAHIQTCEALKEMEEDDG